MILELNSGRMRIKPYRYTHDVYAMFYFLGQLGTHLGNPERIHVFRGPAWGWRLGGRKTNAFSFLAVLHQMRKTTGQSRMILWRVISVAKYFLFSCCGASDEEDNRAKQNDSLEVYFGCRVPGRATDHAYGLRTGAHLVSMVAK